MDLNLTLERLLRQHVGDTQAVVQCEPVSGGDSHQSFVATVGELKVFIKTNSSPYSPALRSEYQDLKRFHSFGQSVYPIPIMFDQIGEYAVLIMNYRALGGLGDYSSEQLGRSLAEQHLITSAKFGWDCDNWIGLTPQINTWSESWLSFYRDQRLIPQLARAITNGLSSACVNLVETVVANLDAYIDDAAVKPALLHGDLWAGNASYDVEKKEPVLYDPAPYFGDAEADIAMTELFGGFSPSFYKGYYQIAPKSLGYEQRKKIYNLYHALNHFNIFGDAYQYMIEKCCPK